jgi:hypothetical protein
MRLPPTEANVAAEGQQAESQREHALGGQQPGSLPLAAEVQALIDANREAARQRRAARANLQQPAGEPDGGELMFVEDEQEVSPVSLQTTSTRVNSVSDQGSLVIALELHVLTRCILMLAR